jgi:DNA-binding MurR/RpiR family transcriptional regulator
MVMMQNEKKNSEGAQTPSHTILARLQAERNSLTPKSRIIADYVVDNPRQAVFLRARELATACGVSEATVIRFVSQLGYQGYGDFIQDLREIIDTALTSVDRFELMNKTGPGAEIIGQVVNEELDNLRNFYEKLDLDAVDQAVTMLMEAPQVYVIGSRLSYTFSYYLGWSLTKIRKNISILKGSDSTSIDMLTIAPGDSLVVVFATTRYPTELIRLARLVRRLGLKLIVISDNNLCPLNQFAQLVILVRCLHFPLVGNPGPMSCLVNCITMEMAARSGHQLREHQENLENVYREHDILFNSY